MTKNMGDIFWELHQRKSGYLFNGENKSFCYNKTCLKSTETKPFLSQFDDDWGKCSVNKSDVCPYYYRKEFEYEYSDKEHLITKNPLRFVQCYLNSNEFMDFLGNDFIAYGSVFRCKDFSEGKTDCWSG